MSPTVSGRAGKRLKSGPFWTIAGKGGSVIPRPADHVSGFTMTVSVAKGTKLDLRFERDTAKALRFNDREAADTAFNALRLFMRGGLQSYEIVKHEGTV